MLFLPLLASTILGIYPVQQHQTNYQRVVVSPDPNNGYEDYIRATDVIRAENLSVCLNWSPNQYDSMLAQKQRDIAEKNANPAAYGWSESNEAQLAVAKQIHDLDYLGVQRFITDHFGAAFTLIRAGNGKRVWDPRAKLDAESIFPEMADFRQVAKLIRADAYVRFADGDAKRGTDELLDGLTFARRIGGNLIIGALVSDAAQAIFLLGFEEHLSQLSDKDAVKIAKMLDEMLSQPPAFSEAIKGEKSMALGSVQLLLKSPTSTLGLSSGEQRPGDPLTNYLTGLSPSERDNFRSSLIAAINERYDHIAARYEGEESTWLDKSEELQPIEPKSISTVQDCVDMVVSILMPVFEQATITELRVRAQLRLLDLHARIIDYRWRTGHLPNTLTDVVSDKLTLDPLSHAPFQYELRESSYRLYSKGIASTGPIELKYSKPANSQGGNDPIPPR